MLIKYIKSVLWRAVKRLSSTEDAQCLKVKVHVRIVYDTHNSNHFPTQHKVTDLSNGSTLHSL